MEEKNDLLKQAVPRLSAWYGEHRREMPWRAEPTPYRVWISEIMLQQTRIETVLPYYRRFLKELPAVEDLAAVRDDKLMKLWEGLGYYSRARNLKKAAAVIVASYGGRLPAEADELQKLPGIGAYTAGAIASIAFGRPEPAVDGNVLRVVMRLLARDDDVAKDRTKKGVASELRAVYPRGAAASALTQAWMELGEVICLPNGAPRCADCPLAGICRARASGDAERFPVKSPKKARRIMRKTVLLLSRGGRYAVRRRDNAGLLAGLWEFPNTDGILDEAGVVSYLRGQGIEPLEIVSCGQASHLFTHLEWRMTGYRVSCGGHGDGWSWKSAAEIARDCAFPSAFRCFVAQLNPSE